MHLKKNDNFTSRRNFIRLLLAGGVAGFGKGEKHLQMPTATVGVRGTGVYVEAEPWQTYYCNCYGEADITATADPTVTRSVKTRYHESPLFIYSSISDSGNNEFIERAPVFNHTDAELIMLENVVFRRPPFFTSEYREGDEGGGGGGH